MSEQRIVRDGLPPSFPRAPAPPPPSPRTTSHPVVAEDGAQVGFLILTKVAEGYEGRCYRPAGLKPGVLATIPLADMEPLWAALYDDNGVCVRMLDD